MTEQLETNTEVREDQNSAEAKRDVILYKFTNREESPHLDNILAMFYTGCNENTVGIMESWDLELEEEALILVGVQADENGKPVCFPLAKVLKAEDVRNYLSPNGKGGYFDPLNPAEADAAREEMKSITEATVE